jgi:polynucleotide 5'-hydroxyl-kinase GRC3/NOL9
MECIADLVDSFRGARTDDTPLVINTHGWVQGMGFELLISMFRLVEPSHVVQILSSEDSFGDAVPAIPKALFTSHDLRQACRNHPHLLNVSSVAGSSPSLTLSNVDKRNLQLFSYFRVSDDVFGRSMTYEVSWNHFRLHFIDGDVKPSQAALVLNASVVALVVDEATYAQYNPVRVQSPRSWLAALLSKKRMTNIC